MSIVELDEKQLVVFEDFERAIGGLAEQYLPLTIAGPEDKKGYEAVYAARQDVKKRRVRVEHMRKELKANALEFGRKVDGAAKKIEALLTPVEEHLQKQEAEYNAARERIKAEAEAARKAKLQSRIDALAAVRAAIPLLHLEPMTDAQFESELAKATEADAARKVQEAAEAKAEQERIAEQERRRKEDEARIAAERARLEAERRQLEEAQRIEREKVEAERRRVEELAAAERAKQAEAQRLIDEERAKLKAEAERLHREEFERQAKLKAEQEARERLAREQAEQERREADRKALEAQEAARREAMKPDVQKLREYAAALSALPPPTVSDEQAVSVLLDALTAVEAICVKVWQWCKSKD